jgi:hypothetical protein
VPDFDFVVVSVASAFTEKEGSVRLGAPDGIVLLTSRGESS